MNQILLTDNDNNKKKSSSKNNANDIKKIIRFFAVVILVFGVAIGGVYGYKIYNNNKEKDKKVSKPQVETRENDSGITIIANSEVGISKIIYSWDDIETEELAVNGSSSYEKLIDKPDGMSTLKVKIIDQNGQEENKIFTYESNEETIEIDVSIVEEGELKKIKIVTTSESPLEYIEYNWNDEEKVRVEAQNAEDTKMETIIDINTQKSILTVTAVDCNNNSETINKPFKWVNNPVIEVTKDGDKLYMKMSHDKGFEKIEFNVNGKEYTYDENSKGYDAEKKEIEYYFNLIEGENTVIIKATSTEKTTAEFRGKRNYPDPE